jgi:carbon monoxide dehydrogenase subunit G
MPEISYTTTMQAPRADVWEFVRDIDNWAPLATGYQGHEVVDERESIWTIKGDVGPISRVTKFRITIEEWIEGDRVAFAVQGLNEPITGQGVIRLSDSGPRTEILGEGTLEFGGNLGPVVNYLLEPWVQAGADELVTKIVAAVTGEAVRPRRRWRVVLSALWWYVTSVWRGLKGLVARLWRRGKASPES